MEYYSVIVICRGKNSRVNAGEVKGRGGLDSHGIIFGSLLRCLFSGNCPIFAFLSAPVGRHWREDVSLTHVVVSYGTEN